MFERNIPVRGWTAPKRVELNEGQTELLYWYGDDVDVEDGPGVLTEFIALGSATDTKVLEYARRWGVLELCRDHGLPRMHKPPMILSEPAPVFDDNVCQRRRSRDVDLANQPAAEDRPFGENLADWRILADRIRSIIEVATQLKIGQVGDAYTWMIALGRYGDADTIKESGRKAYWSGTHWMLAGAVQQILDIANVRPVFEWKGDKGFGIEIGAPPQLSNERSSAPGGLFSAIASHLAFALSESDGFAMCSGCGKPYSIKGSRPRTGENQYCSECRAEGIPAQVRMRNYRQRKKASRETP